jgi:hypothetical protein
MNEDELLAYDEEEKLGDLEMGEIELAAELLSVSDEQELDEFLGALLGRTRGFLRTPAGRSLNDLLRTAARKVLPGISTAALASRQPAVNSSEVFGIETEGLSPEDRDLEIARRLVRLTLEAARRLSRGANGNPTVAARQALLGAAQRHAPGLASRMRRRGSHSSTFNGRKGETTMHDLDRTLRSQESETESYDFENSLFETEGDYEEETYEITEEQENDLAAELLAVSDEQELDEFFRGLLKKARGAVGPALKKYLAPVAKKLIPIAARAAGGFFGGPAGAQLAGKIGDFATTLFEADFESMEPEVADMEVAKSFVRFATAAANNAAANSGTSDPTTVARNAVVNAAKVHAPGLLRPRGNTSATSGRGVSRSRRANSGRWIRRAGRIVLLGV